MDEPVEPEVLPAALLVVELEGVVLVEPLMLPEALPVVLVSDERVVSLLGVLVE